MFSQLGSLLFRNDVAASLTANVMSNYLNL
jgi:hypothetical protein